MDVFQAQTRCRDVTEADLDTARHAEITPRTSSDAVAPRSTPVECRGRRTQTVPVSVDLVPVDRSMLAPARR